MVWRLAWRSAGCTMLLLSCAAVAGCAALDLLGGHLPGDEEEPAPKVDPPPYPAARRTTTQSPTQAESATDNSETDTLAPIVSTSEATKAAPAPVGQTPARGSLTDDASDQPTEMPQPAQAQLNPAAPPTAVKAEPPVAATPSPAPEPAPSAAPAADVKQADATLASAETKSASQESGPVSPPAKTVQTPEERMAQLLRRRDELVATLEEEVKLRSGKPDPSAELPRIQQQLRLLYLLADRPDDAVGEVASLPEAEQEAFKQLMFGLGTWLSADEERRPTFRNARVIRSLKDAAGQLAAAAKLDVRNLRFCETVEGFGWYKEFPTPQFRPKQQLILYAEVDNFATEKKGTDTFETELQASYQIFDAAGTLVDERQLPLDKELCRNQRRDYFLAYRIYLPDGIIPGRYRLELTVEDLKAKEHYQGRKLGDGTIEFSIR